MSGFQKVWPDSEAGHRCISEGNQCSWKGKGDRDKVGLHPSSLLAYFPPGVECIMRTKLNQGRPLLPSLGQGIFSGVTEQMVAKHMGSALRVVLGCQQWSHPSWDRTGVVVVSASQGPCVVRTAGAKRKSLPKLDHLSPFSAHSPQAPGLVPALGDDSQLSRSIQAAAEKYLQKMIPFSLTSAET